MAPGRRDLHQRNAVPDKLEAARAEMTVMGESSPALSFWGPAGVKGWGGPGRP